MKKVGEAVEKISDSLTSSIGNDQMTRATGCPVGHVTHSMTSGVHGAVSMSDLDLLERIHQFSREQTPPRNVHALGTGAYGKLTITNDISKYTKADLFSKVGKETKIFARFSGIFTERGDADTTRDPRGFALKFYTKEGNWDLLGINTPVFAVRDAKIGPDNVHSFKRCPISGIWNATQRWDYIVNHPEGLHQSLMLYTDRIGTPMSYRTMNAYGCHTFSLLNDKNERFWVKFHIISKQGAKGFTKEQAKIVAGQDPNFLSRDLRTAIEQKNYPKWKFMMQIMSEDEGYKYPYTFDPTKIWKHTDYPLIEIGEIEMNDNPVDYFSEVEQSAFSPTNIVPGIGLSPDRLLQGRLLIYDTTQYHRIGPNYKQLKINCPQAGKSQTPYVMGYMNTEVKNKFPHYYPSVFGGYKPNSKYNEPPLRCGNSLDYHKLPYEGTDEDYFGQVKDFWNILNPTQKNNLCDNLADSLEGVKEDKIVNMALDTLKKVNSTLYNNVSSLLNERKMGKGKTDNEKLCEAFANELKNISSTS